MFIKIRILLHIRKRQRKNLLKIDKRTKKAFTDVRNQTTLGPLAIIPPLEQLRKILSSIPIIEHPCTNDTTTTIISSLDPTTRTALDTKQRAMFHEGGGKSMTRDHVNGTRVLRVTLHTCHSSVLLA